MNLYDASDVERRAVFVEAAAGIGIRQDMIEKDFWISWLLNRMFSDEELARDFSLQGRNFALKSIQLYPALFRRYRPVARPFGSQFSIWKINQETI